MLMKQGNRVSQLNKIRYRHRERLQVGLVVEGRDVGEENRVGGRIVYSKDTLRRT